MYEQKKCSPIMQSSDIKNLLESFNKSVQQNINSYKNSLKHKKYLTKCEYIEDLDTI